MKAIRCENLCKTFGSGNNAVHAVNGITAQFEPGTFYSIIGRSGSGKSTFLYLLSGILMPDQGEVYYGKYALSQMKQRQLERYRRRHTGFIFQDYRLLEELTVKENILLPAVLDGKDPDMEWCDAVMESLSITDNANRFPFELSGGQQQRTAIGRAIMNKPSCLFADEPTGNLDKKTGEAVLDFLLRIRDLYRPMILLVTHDLDIARSADVMLQIEDGRLVRNGYESRQNS